MGQDPGGIQARIGLFIKVQVHAIGKGGPFESLDERLAVTGAGTVMQLEIGTAVGQLLGHAENRSDADATREQQAAPSLTHQREEVTRFTDEQPIATVDLLMHALRTTARGRVLKHTDQVAMALLRVIAQ
ncbi:hypothetical protein D3C80_1496320 [compost metagenome]